MFGVFPFDAVHAGLLEINVTFEETMKLADPGRVAHLAECLGLDLADAFAGNLELAADFLEGAGVTVGEAEAEREHAALTISERV